MDIRWAAQMYEYTANITCFTVKIQRN